MKIKLNSTTPDQLDWLVAKCKGKIISIWGNTIEVKDRYSFEDGYKFSPSTNREQGGRIIDREKIGTVYYPDMNCVTGEILPRWVGYVGYDVVHSAPGPTRLIAAMRCYVASKMGNDVEVPEELK